MDAVQENQPAGVFAGLDVHVGDTVQRLGQIGQLEVVGSEQGQRASFAWEQSHFGVLLRISERSRMAISSPL